MVEVGEGVELHRLVPPRPFYATPDVGGEPRGLADVAFDDFVVGILNWMHDRDPLSVGQQKGLSGLGQHPKGRITTSNPELLGCSSSGGVAENPRSRAHYAHAPVGARRAGAEHGGEQVVACHRIQVPSSQGGGRRSAK